MHLEFLNIVFLSVCFLFGELFNGVSTFVGYLITLFCIMCINIGIVLINSSVLINW